MANFVAVVDPDGERRRLFVRQIRAEIAPLDDLRIGEVEAGDFMAVWAAQDRAPISTASSSTAAAIVWGDAISASESKRIDATDLLRIWDPCMGGSPQAFDGFHAALRFDVERGLLLGADPLGFFPIYYAHRSGTLVVGSSPELFRHHPYFPPRLSCTGLIGLLLTHAPFDGRGLLEGIRRLPPGHAIVWCHGTEPAEVLQYRLPASSRGHRRSFQSDVDQVDRALARAIERQMPPASSPGMLLSGGRDSRLLAGYLRERSDRVHALTLGKPTDYDMMCATRVVRALGCAHTVADLDEHHLPAAAELQARWEHLGTAFSNVHMWGAIAPLRGLPPHFFTGHILHGRSVERTPLAFDELFRTKTNRGFQPATLRQLLRHDVFDDVVERLEQRRREVYEAGSAIDGDPPSRFFIAHDWRAHAGGVPWKLSFGSWPVLPILDRGLLDVLFTLPASSLVNRRAQDEILRRRFPDLARLPLVRNADNTLPLLPSTTERIQQAIVRAVQPIQRHVPGRLERRYYYRIYDINGPGWREVRRRAEPHRDRLAPLFNMDELAELVPPPDVRIELRAPIADGFRPKLLIGLMIWSARHLS